MLPMLRGNSPQACYPAPELAPNGTSHGWALARNPGTPNLPYAFVNGGGFVNPARPGFADAIPIRWGKSRGFLALFFPDTPPPILRAIAPPTGPTTGGTLVTLTGFWFLGATSVTIGGVPLTGIVVTGNSITGTTGAHAAGPANVVITTPAGTSTLVGGFTYAAAPPVVLATTTPVLGIGGTAMTIDGTGFTGATAVTINGVPCTGIVVVSDIQITCVSPALAGVGPYDLTVTTPAGSGTLPASVTVLPP